MPKYHEAAIGKAIKRATKKWYFPGYFMQKRGEYHGVRSL
jgi:hypothetical protein